MKQASFKSQGGFSRLSLVIVIGIILGVSGLLIWQGRGSDTARAPHAQNLPCNADKELCAFLARHKAQTHYSVNALSKSGDQKTDTVLQVDGKNAYLKLVGMIDYEVIGIGTTTYTKTPDGIWWKFTKPNSTLTQYLQNGTPQLEEPNTGNKNTIKYTKKGTEPCGEQTCLAYGFKNQANPTVTTTLWFDATTYELRRTLTITEANSYDASYDFSPVTISVPSPVKDLPEGQFVGPNQDAPLPLPPGSDG